MLLTALPAQMLRSIAGLTATLTAAVAVNSAAAAAQAAAARAAEASALQPCLALTCRVARRQAGNIASRLANVIIIH